MQQWKALRWITNFTYKIEHAAAEVGAFYQLACKYYREVVLKEAILANITEKDHILCIGGGICPFSAVLFHQSTGAKVTVIDNNMDCIPKAGQVIERLGLEDYVRVLYHDANSSELDLSEYSAIHLAMQVTPMSCVFDRVEKQAKPGTKLLIRQPKKSLKSAYSGLQKQLLGRAAYVSHKGCNIGATLLYIKPEQDMAAV